jgi:hypothetical protein
MHSEFQGRKWVLEDVAAWMASDVGPQVCLSRSLASVCPRIASHRIASHRIASHRIASYRIVSCAALVVSPRTRDSSPLRCMCLLDVGAVHVLFHSCCGRES